LIEVLVIDGWSSRAELPKSRFLAALIQGRRLDT
jgi:hypothetical protein